MTGKKGASYLVCTNVEHDNIEIHNVEFLTSILV